MTRDEVITELLDLVTVDEQGRPSKRRLVFDGSSGEQECLKPFLEERLLSTESVGDTTLIAASHDAFLVNWPPLTDEIDTKVIALRARRSVETAADDWEANQRHPAILLQGRQLAKAMEDTGADFEPVSRRESTSNDHPRQLNVRRERRQLTTRVDLDDSARAFLEASAEADRVRIARAKRKTVAVVASLSVIALVAVVGAGWAIYSQSLAKTSEQEAIAQRLIAEARVNMSKSVDAVALQELLAGRSLTRISDEQLYPIVVGSASTYKIIENPTRAGGDGLVPVQSVAVSPNGTVIASGSTDHTLRLWNADTGALNRTIDLAGNGPVWSVAFNPDGTRIAIGGQDGILQVVNAQTGERVGTLMQHPTWVSSAAFNHNGNLIATGDGIGTVRVWDLVTGKPVTEITSEVPGSSARSVSFGPNSDVVASVVASKQGFGVRLSDIAGHKIAEWARAGSPVMSLAFDRSGDRLAVGSQGGWVDILNGRLEPLREGRFRAHPNLVNTVAFNSDGKRIVTGGDDSLVKVWDANSTQSQPSTFGGHGGSVTSVTFTPGDTRIVSGSVDGTVRVWNAVFGLTILAGQGPAVRAVDISPDNRVVASAGSDGTVRLWDSHTAGSIGRLGEPAAAGDTGRVINSLAFDRGGGRIVTASNDGRVSVWDRASGSVVNLNTDPPPDGVPLRNPRMQSVAVDRGGKYIAAGGFDGLVRLWDARTLSPIGVLRAQKAGVPYQVWSVAFSPDGRKLVTGSGFDKGNQPNNLIQLWNVETLAADGDSMRGPNDTTVFAVAFTSSGQQVVSGSSDGTVRSWDIKERKEIPKPLSKDQSPVYSLAVAHKAPWIAAGGGGGAVRVWDLAETPPDETPLERHHDWVQGVAVSSDDTLIVSGSADGNIQLWPGPADVGKAVCSKLTADVSRKQWDQWVKGKVPYAPLCSD
jgi:WD40 repeat protein